MSKDFVCTKCGYKVYQMARMSKCPLCAKCARCDKRVENCKCIEGE